MCFLCHQKTIPKHSFWKAISLYPDEALELYHDAIIILYQNIKAGRLEELRVKFSTYIISTMKFRWMNKKSPSLISIENVYSLTTEEDERPEELKEMVQGAMRLLDKKCREMLTLRYYIGWDYEDISSNMGYNKGDVVRNLISRCRTKFRELLAKAPKNV